MEVKTAFTSIAWFIGLLTNLYFILRVFSDDRFLIVRLCNYFLPWIGALTLIFLILSITAKKWTLSTLHILSLSIVSVIYAPLFLNCACNPVYEQNALKIMSYNLRQFNTDMHAVATVIIRERPDVLLIQEIEERSFQELMKSSENLYNNDPIYVVYSSDIMQAVLSRFPVTEIESSALKNRLQKTLVKTVFGPIIVLNIHAYKFGWKDRHYRMKRMIEEDVVPATEPLILGGDFNTNDQSMTYGLIKKYLHDVHWEVGCGLGFTYPARLFLSSKNYFSPAMIRIDHIFHNNYFTPIRTYRLYDSGGSDHYPLVAEFLFHH
jgi:vancomycin resistance protein VanJ